MWSRTDLDRYRWTGLFRPGEALSRANLMLLRPYEPGKIPVVMVHGLISSPLAWIPMLNELLRDPTIQQRYQFLLYMYPTGVPIPIAAAGLRDSLLEAEQMYDPEGRDPAFDQMVLLGHSMGGLLSHVMAVDSGDQFWRLNSDRRFDEILGPPEVLDELRALPVLRAAAVRPAGRLPGHAAPRLGPEPRAGRPGRREPDLRARPHQQPARAADQGQPRRLRPPPFRRLPTSIETLDPDSPILQALLAMKPGPDVTFHSIIGSLRPGGGRADDRRRRALPELAPRRGRLGAPGPLRSRRPEAPGGDPRGPPDPAGARRPPDGSGLGPPPRRPVARPDPRVDR